ncbi:MAG TPA: FMN-binding protein [Ruminiclostridium sp.]
MSNFKKIILGTTIIVVVLLVGIFGGKYLFSVQKYKTVFKELKISSVDLSKVSEGNYIGSYDTEFVGAKVSVTVKDHKITDIVLIEHKTERGKLAEVIPEKVLESQSLDVAAISGATDSSKAILKAIKNALKSHKE